MTRQTGSTNPVSLSDSAVAWRPAESRSPSLFVMGAAAFHRKRVWKGLGEAGYRLRRFTGPAALYAAIESTPPDAILCEVSVAIEPVFELLDRLAGQGSDACVILIGPEIGAGQVARCLREGAFDYVTVPVAASCVLDSLQKGLMNRQTFQAVRDLSGQLAAVNAALAGERDVLRQWNMNLSLLNRLTQSLAGSLSSEDIVQALFRGLAGLVPVDVIGLSRPDPSRVWTWARSTVHESQEQRVREHLLCRLTATAPVSQAHAPVRGVLTDPPLSERSAHLPYACAMTTDRSIVSIPLTFTPERQGLLHAERQQGAFSESDIQLLSMVGASVSLALQNAAIHQQVQELASHDGLTGLLNRRVFEEALAREFNASRRYHAPASLILVDVDYFKRVNDLLGHAAGDGVLKVVATLMQQAVRDTDSVGRCGGEEFGIVLPHTNLVSAAVLAERLRDQIGRHEFDTDRGPVRITVSVGIARLPDGTIHAVSEWMAAADAALYDAKGSGRNGVVIHTPDRYACA